MAEKKNSKIESSIRDIKDKISSLKSSVNSKKNELARKDLTIEEKKKIAREYVEIVKAIKKLEFDLKRGKKTTYTFSGDKFKHFDGIKGKTLKLDATQDEINKKNFINGQMAWEQLDGRFHITFEQLSRYILPEKRDILLGRCMTDMALARDLVGICQVAKLLEQNEPEMAAMAYIYFGLDDRDIEMDTFFKMRSNDKFYETVKDFKKKTAGLSEFEQKDIASMGLNKINSTSNSMEASLKSILTGKDHTTSGEIIHDYKNAQETSSFKISEHAIEILDMGESLRGLPPKEMGERYDAQVNVIAKNHVANMLAENDYKFMNIKSLDVKNRLIEHITKKADREARNGIYQNSMIMREDIGRYRSEMGENISPELKQALSNFTKDLILVGRGYRESEEGKEESFNRSRAQASQKKTAQEITERKLAKWKERQEKAESQDELRNINAEIEYLEGELKKNKLTTEEEKLLEIKIKEESFKEKINKISAIDQLRYLRTVQKKIQEGFVTAETRPDVYKWFMENKHRLEGEQAENSIELSRVEMLKIMDVELKNIQQPGDVILLFNRLKKMAGFQIDKRGEEAANEIFAKLDALIASLVSNSARDKLINNKITTCTKDLKQYITERLEESKEKEARKKDQEEERTSGEKESSAEQGDSEEQSKEDDGKKDSEDLAKDEVQVEERDGVGVEVEETENGKVVKQNNAMASDTSTIINGFVVGDVDATQAIEEATEGLDREPEGQSTRAALEAQQEAIEQQAEEEMQRVKSLQQDIPTGGSV